MVMFMLRAGLWISEVKDLDLLFVDERYGWVTINADNGGKWCIVPMNDELLKVYGSGSTAHRLR
jgi:integrase/recombinase XerC